MASSDTSALSKNMALSSFFPLFSFLLFEDCLPKVGFHNIAGDPKSV